MIKFKVIYINSVVTLVEVIIEAEQIISTDHGTSLTLKTNEVIAYFSNHALVGIIQLDSIKD